MNSEYKLNINKNSDKIIDYIWSIGSVVDDNDDLVKQIEDENKIKSKEQQIGLITVSEYIRANSNMKQCGNIILNNTNSTICLTTNWIYNIIPTSGYLWTISTTNNGVFDIIGDIYNPGNINVHNYANAEHVAVVPVINLSADIALFGTGTEFDPYIIAN